MTERCERDIWIDALRGIAIVLVVAGHALRGLEHAGTLTGPLFAFLDVRLYAVHVQLLFFVSGLVVAGSLARRGPRPFAASRFPAILWPMIIWTYVFLGAKLLAGPYQNEPVSWDALLTPPVPGQLHLWFLWALFLMHLLVAALWSVTPRRALPGMVAGLFVASLAVTTLRLPAALEAWAGMALSFLPYFALGVLIGFHGIRSRRGTGTSVLAAALAVGAFLLAPQLRAISGSFLLPSLMACVGMYFAGSLLLSSPRFTQVLAYLGMSAMAIYVLHTIFSAGMREVLFAAGIETLWAQVIMGVLAGVLLPILVRETCLRIRVARPLAIA